MALAVPHRMMTNLVVLPVMMMISVVLFFVIVWDPVQGILIYISPADLNWLSMPSLMAIFSVTEYSHQNIQNALLPLLKVPNDSCREAYTHTYLDREQSTDLWRYAKNYPALHPILLPLDYVMYSFYLSEVLGHELEIYDPGVIALGSFEGSYFNIDQWRTILSRLGQHPEYCGNLETYVFSKRVGFRNDWELTEDLTSTCWIAPWETAVFQLVGDAYEKLSGAHTGTFARGKSGYSDNDAVHDALSTLLEVDDIWIDGYKFLRGKIIANTQFFSPTRRALWHAKLLLLTLNIAFGYVTLLPDNGRLDSIAELIKEFARLHRFCHVPPFLASELHQWLNRYESLHSLGLNGIFDEHPESLVRTLYLTLHAQSLQPATPRAGSFFWGLCLLAFVVRLLRSLFGIFRSSL